ncbi:MAG TPA: selenocysteine-specific translation elongation factor, partial [Isosphaeraceae bacterium]|nr:selenocysteine-specific translation elongation factor [Isosphaeraceae bacterium]
MADERDFVLGTAGHIDHGKTALVRVLTGINTDRLPAEKQRGITIDLGFASLDLGPYHVAVIDVPGHERFIRNMLAGASGLDLAMLVIAADDSVMPQTREHLEILRLLGLSGGVVVLTKCDLADSAWLNLVEEEIRGLVAGTFLEGAEILRTSSATGHGIDDVRAALRRLCESAPGRGDPGLFRMAIDRSFTIAGHGTVVTGTVASGSAAVGDDLELFPAGRTVRVRGLQRHEQAVERLGRGARAAINLGGVHHTEIHRGDELATPGYLVASRLLSVEVHGSHDAPRPLRHRARYRIHVGTAEVSASLSLLENNECGAASSGMALAQLFLAQPVVAVYGQPLVIREESPPATLGGGRVLQPLARRLRRRDHAELERLRRASATDPVIRLTAALAHYGLKPGTNSILCRDTGIPIGSLPAALSELAASGSLVELPLGSRRSVSLLAEVVAELEGRVLRALSRLHADQPRQSAIGRARVAAALADLGQDALVAAVIERLRVQGQVTCDTRTVALAGCEPKLSQGERKLKAEIA